MITFWCFGPKLFATRKSQKERLGRFSEDTTEFRSQYLRRVNRGILTTMGPARARKPETRPRTIYGVRGCGAAYAPHYTGV